MKVGIPVNRDSMDTNVCLSFGRAPYYLIYDIESEEGSFLENGAASSQGGAGIKAAQLIVDSGIDAVIVPRCGKNAADVLISADIKLYKISSDSISENIEAFIEGKLSPLDDIHSGLHRHGGR
ncbi:MAG TPA: dinitrogenase iron-molybdenum cofactor biosynthesis protein [Tepidimicrobium sp.]|nr:dinitrogenase iron-molybdenum cofactor biosynthesis protein [Tepidimicrobium sp.]